MKQTLAAPTLLALVGLMFACESPQTPPETSTIYLDYSEAIVEDTHPLDLDPCFFTGPHETVALATVSSAFVYHSVASCDPIEPYRTGYFDADLDIVRRSGPAQIEETVSVIYFSGFNLIQRNPDVGDEVLVSLRRAGPDWVVTQLVPVTASTTAVDDGASDNVKLPTTWSDLETEMTDVRNQFQNRCTDSEDKGAQEHKLMSEDEFDTWIHTPGDGRCSDAGTNPDMDASQPDGTVDDRDF